MTVPIEDERFISIWIALTDITLEMGSLYFANGSHVHEGEWNFKNRRHEFGLQYNTGAYNDRIPLEFDISPAVVRRRLWKDPPYTPSCPIGSTPLPLPPFFMTHVTLPTRNGLQEMKAGDATVHFGWTYHAAPPNKARRTREGSGRFFFSFCGGRG